jgi:uncharacterized protein YbjT (DUF2867 family)
VSRVAVIGASGRLGGRLVLEALGLDLRVNAVSRDPSKLRVANERFNAFQGDLEKGQGIDKAVVGCRWVVSAMSSSQPSTCVANLIKAISFRGVERIVLIGRADDTVPAHGLSGRVGALLGKKQVAQDIAGAVELLQVSGLPYLVLKTNGLTDDAGGKEVVTSETHQPPPGKISRVDLARFVFRVVDQPEWACRAVNVGAKG